MSILSPIFLFFFLPITLLIFHLVGRKWGEAGALSVILVSSVLFAQSQGIWFLTLFSVSLIFNYFIIQVLIKKGHSGGKALMLGIIVNLAALAIFKYSGLLARFGLPISGFRQLEILIPITISFLTFQRMTALIDAKSNQEHLQGMRGAMRFGAFASFFPNLLIGPIAYLQEILPQFKRSDFGSVRKINFAIGLTLIAIGLFKKVFIADQIGAAFVDPVWRSLDSGAIPTQIDASFALAGYFVQLYFDFSGYSDIAIGIARLFGIILPTNFFSPFRSVGIIDFYRRWHIGLTRVIARFLFTPLSIYGTRTAAMRRWRGFLQKSISLWIPLIANFFVIGIWHGAKFTFVIFGLIHGIWYVFETEVRSSKRWKNFAKTSSSFVRGTVGRLITLPLLVLTFSLFRAPNLDAFQRLLAPYFSGDIRLWSFIDPSPAMLALLAAAYLIVFFLPNSHELLGRYRPGIITYDVPSYTLSKFGVRWRPTIGWALLCVTLLCLGLYALPKAAPFSYGVF